MCAQQQSLTLARPLWRLNNEIIYIKQPGIILVKGTGQKIAPSAFTQHAYAVGEFAEQVLQDNGNVSMKSVPAAQAWLRWPLRSEAQCMSYSPGQGKLLRHETHNEWNTWPGWGVLPAQGTVQPFLDLIEHLFSNDKGAKRWFMQWLAYPLQHPGTKLFTSVLLWGVRHGTGKSLIGETMGKIYGLNYTELNQRDLYNGFNEWAENKQFVMGDDITGTDKRHESDILKRFITQSELRLNIKHVQSFTVRDCINYFFSANQPTAFFLEDDDRRSFVHEITAEPLTDEFYLRYKEWKDGDGPAALFQYLLKFNTKDFNPSARAMRTEAKDRMIADVRSDLGEWVSRLLGSPDDILRVGQVQIRGDLFTSRELLQLYDPSGRTGTTANGLGREMRRVGVVYALGGKTIRTLGGVDRYYVIRMRDKWSDATPKQITEHVNQRHQAEPVPRQKY